MILYLIVTFSFHLCNRYNCVSKPFKYEVGIDPGLNTWLACVRRCLETGAETLIKISSGKYHRMAKQYIRDWKAAKMTSAFEERARLDRENREIYPRIPSPKGSDWNDYITHCLKFFTEGVRTYTRRRYARLSLNKYIQGQKAMDSIVNKITNKSATIVFIGGAKMSASSPIKKYRRCPGTRKIAISMKKKIDCAVVYVDEHNTSQVCPNCLEKFPEETKRDRMKLCADCVRLPETSPATLITTNHGKRQLKVKRDLQRERIQAQPELIVEAKANQPIARRLVSKWTQHIKTNLLQPNAGRPIVDEANEAQSNEQLMVEGSVVEQPTKKTLKTVWHRDIAAAKCIMYKGKTD